MGGNILSAAHVEMDKTRINRKVHFHLGVRWLYGAGRRICAANNGCFSQGKPHLFTALETQLGLKLNDKKTSLDVLVIDRIDKAPTAN